ncbi:MAG: DUF2142 domain-containing protein [Deltaproteobacteria bacterium]|nr:DUF2142 domain-containing protein [Deltaproteobacteria bacterium]
MTTRVVMFALALAALVPMLRMLDGGLWEPWELHRAEAARVVADGETPAWSVPEVEGEGERPPLATWVTALGFAAGGSEVANGKLAVAAFLLLCVVLALWVLQPLLDLARTLGIFVVFFALPLVFFQGASAGGDGVAFGAYALAFAGLVRLLEASTEPETRAKRDLVVGLGATAVGLVLSYFALGAVLGLALPIGASAFTSGLGGGLRRPHGPPDASRPEWIRFGLRWAAVVAALALLAWFVVAGLAHKPVEETERFTLALGGTKTLLPLDTFDLLLSRLAYVLFPWCAFVPLALAWAMRPRDSEEGADGTVGAAPPDRTLSRHAAVHLLLGYALVAYWHWRFHPSPLVFAFPLALLVAEYLAHALQEGRGLRFAGTVTAILAVLVLRDSFAFQKEFLQIIGFPKPGDMVTEAPTYPLALAVASGVFLLVVLFTHVVPASTGAGERVFGWYAQQREALRGAFRDLWRGPAPVRLAGAAVLAPWVLGALVWAAVLGVALVARYTEFSRWTVSHLGFQALLVVGVLPFGVGLADVCWRGARRFIAGSSGTVRGGLTLAGGVLVSLTVGFTVAPALDAQFSLEPAARAAAEEGDLTGRLQLLQVESAATRYYPSLAGGKLVANIEEAAAWLGQAPPGQPRYLVFPSRNQVLNEVNQKFRETRGGELLPVVSDPEGRYLLGVSELMEGEVNRSPLARVVLRERPAPRYPVLEGNFDNKVRYLGYDLTSYPDGTVAALQNVTITHYWECLAKITGDYEVFVHVDGMGDRINGDHDPAEGLYPTRYWRPGDFVIDRQKLRIPFFARPSREPTAYQMYVGLFRGESRLPLAEGEGNDNRLYGGVIRVR